MEGEVGGQDRDERPEATCLPLRPLIPNPLLITSIRLQVHPLHFLYVIDVFVTQTHTHTGLRIRIRSDPVFLHGSGSGFKNFSGSGSESGFQISLDPDPVSAQILEQKKLQKGLLKRSIRRKLKIYD